MKKAFFLSIITILLLFSCSTPKMDKDLLDDMLFSQNKGIIAGASIGDTWEEIKTNIHSEWEIDETNKSISKTYDILNFATLHFDFFDGNNCNGLSFSLSAEKGNHLTISELQNSLKTRLNAILPINNDGHWIYVDKQGNNYSTYINTDNGNENMKSFDFSIVKM